MNKTLLFIFFFLFIPILVSAEEIEDLAPNAGSAIMIEASTGEILFKKNIDEKLAPASMTKMMSLLLIFEEIDKGNIKWDEMITTSEHASSMGGSQIFLKVGEKMSVLDMIKGITIASGNDATVAMAERVSGTEESFVKRMNEKARELGLKNTNFINATGLDADNHYSSAYDMSIIAKELVKHEKVLEFSSTYEDYLRKDTSNPFWLVNTNRLVKFYPEIDGLKTGYTSSAKYCLTATADTKKMLDYVFNTYNVKNIIDENTPIEEKKVELGKILKTEIIPKETITILSKKSDVERNITYKTNIKKLIAPIKKGETVGTIEIMENNKKITEVEATVKENILKANIFTIFIRNLNGILNTKINI